MILSVIRQKYFTNIWARRTRLCDIQQCIENSMFYVTFLFYFFLFVSQKVCLQTPVGPNVITI